MMLLGYLISTSLAQPMPEQNLELVIVITTRTVQTFRLLILTCLRHKKGRFKLNTTTLIDYLS
jgi:hypothetical protein